VTVNDCSDRVLRAAMDRILAGAPSRRHGSCTVTALAAEAGRRTAAWATTVPRDFRDAIEHRPTSALPAAGEPDPARSAAYRLDHGRDDDIDLGWAGQPAGAGHQALAR
jgi:hypothetical protein